MTEQTHDETQPTDANQIEQLTRQIEELIRKVDHIPTVIKESIDRELAERGVIGKSDITMIVSKTLDGYSTTTEIHRIVSNAIAGINRGMTDGFASVEKKLVELTEFTRQKVTAHDTQIAHLIDENELVKIRQDKHQETLATVKANQVQLLDLVIRVDNAIRGDGEKNGLVAQQTATRLEVERIAGDQIQMKSDLHQLTMLTAENARLHRDQLEREKRRDEKQEKLKARFKEGAYYVFTRGLLPALSAGGGLTVLTAIGQALIGS